MATFEELGLGSALAEAARAAGYDAPTPLQAASAPVLLRGANVVLHASSGAGVIAAFGLPLLERLASGERAVDGPRALVLAPTAERAEAVAEGLGTLAGASGIAVRAAGTGWRTEGADVLVLTPVQALRSVQRSALKLEAAQTLIIADAAEMFALGNAEVLDTVVALVPREAQRIVTTTQLTEEVERLIEAHARRAMTVPPRPADRRSAEGQEPIGQIGYVVVEEAAKDELLARLLESVEESAVVYTRTAARAERVRAELSRRGIVTGDPTRADIRVSAFAAQTAEHVARVISYDVPFSADQLRALHESGGTVIVTALELPHLQRTAAEVPFTLKHRRARSIEHDALDGFRSSVRTAIETEDLDAQLLVLEPLFEAHSAAEVAAALSALLRRRTPVAVASAAADSVGSAPRAAASTFTRLFLSVGSRDNVRPGDLVGAITGEAGVKGDQVGRVDIRDTFSVVEVAADVAERVIRALNGTTMRGRSLRVDFDRKTGATEERGGRGGTGGRGPARSGAARGPRDDTPRGERRPREGPPRRRPTDD